MDAVLLERSPAPLLRAALAVAVALGPALLEAPADDFEAALRVLKLRPVAWTAEEARDVLSSGLCGDLVPAGAVEAAAAAVGARAEAEARLEEEGRARERVAERERREMGEREKERRRRKEEEGRRCLLLLLLLLCSFCSSCSCSCTRLSLPLLRLFRAAGLVDSLPRACVRRAGVVRGCGGGRRGRGFGRGGEFGRRGWGQKGGRRRRRVVIQEKQNEAKK